MEAQSFPVTIVGGGEKTASGTIQIVRYTAAQRVTRTALRVGLALFVTVLMVFIPLLHFILVPLGLLGAVAWGWFTAKQKTAILSGSGTCPACANGIKIMPRTVKAAFEENCEHCHRPLRISWNATGF